MAASPTTSGTAPAAVVTTGVPVAPRSSARRLSSSIRPKPHDAAVEGGCGDRFVEGVAAQPVGPGDDEPQIGVGGPDVGKGGGQRREILARIDRAEREHVAVPAGKEPTGRRLAGGLGRPGQADAVGDGDDPLASRRERSRDCRASRGQWVVRRRLPSEGS
jgi:hypothetical protein